MDMRECNSFLLSKLMFAAGHIALKQLVHMEEVHKDKETQNASQAKSKSSTLSAPR